MRKSKAEPAYKPSKEDIKKNVNNFSYHKPHCESQTKRYEAVRASLLKQANQLMKLCPHSRELSLALTKLEEALFWANASIARNEKPEAGAVAAATAAQQQPKQKRRQQQRKKKAAEPEPEPAAVTPSPRNGRATKSSGNSRPRGKRKQQRQPEELSHAVAANTNANGNGESWANNGSVAADREV